MALTFGYFDSVNGDRVYDADSISAMFRGLLSDGIYQGYLGGFAVSAGSGMAVNVATGRAIVRDKWAENDAVVSLTIAAANSALPRWDAVVLEKDTASRTVILRVITGTPASSPARPSISRDAQGLYDLVLAYVYIPAGASSVTAANITDTRSDGSVCGWITGLVKQVDTSALFAQFAAAYQDNLDNMEAWEAEQKAAFDAWYSALTEELNVNTYVRAYSGTVVTTTDGQTVLALPFTSAQYAAGDVLEVYANGLKLSADAFSADPSELTVTLAAESPRGQVYSFEVLKSVIGTAS